MTVLNKENFLGMVDHSILKPETPLEKVIEEAVAVSEAGVFSVCVKPSDIVPVRDALEQYPTLIGTVIGFPHGNSDVRVKTYESLLAMREGADELDIVANYARLLGSELEMKHEVADIAELTDRVKSVYPDVCVKIILETSYFSAEQLESVCEEFSSTSIDFLKTSTGFSSHGATEEALRIMSAAGGSKEVKASGGVRSTEDAKRFVAAGATRLGCSITLELIEEF